MQKTNKKNFFYLINIFNFDNPIKKRSNNYGTFKTQW